MEFTARTVADVAALLGGAVQGSAARRVSGLRSLEAAGPQDVAAVFRAGGQAARASRAGCLLVRASATAAPEGLTPGEQRSLVVVDDPEQALDTLAQAWGPPPPSLPTGVHPTAIVGEGAEVDPSAAVGPWVWIGPRARVGPRTVLHPGVYLGDGAAVGADGVLHPRVYVGPRCRLGDRVLVHPGAVIGADGFGFRQDREGRHHKSPQVGIVQVGDDVEIGANTTIDRARLEATVLADGVKLDDQVHIAHNCVLGEHTAIASLTGLAGGVQVGRRVLMAGQVGIGDGIRVGDGAILTGKAGVTGDIEAGAVVGGWPAIPWSQWKRQALSLRRLPAVIASWRAAGREGRDEDDRGA